jgi:hypothetical protein
MIADFLDFAKPIEGTEFDKNMEIYQFKKEMERNQKHGTQLVYSF